MAEKFSFGLKDTLIQEIKEYAVKNHIEKLIIFGSRARGDYKKTSDIDLAVSGGNIPRFSADLEEETHTLLTFDVVDLGKPVQDELLKPINDEGIVLYEKV